MSARFSKPTAARAESQGSVWWTVVAFGSFCALAHSALVAMALIYERIQFEERVILEVGRATCELAEKIGRIAGVKQVTLEGPVVHVISTAGSQNLDRIISCARDAGGVRSIRTEKPTLEDVFLTLTGKCLRDDVEGESVS